jgi:hypothetical protein
MVVPGAGGPAISGLVAWFRGYLMDDTENRKHIYCPSCTCTDSRVTVEQNSLMAQRLFEQSSGNLENYAIAIEHPG